MGGSAIGMDLINGFAGTIARHGDEVIKSRPVHASAVIPFGCPVVMYKSGGVADGSVVPFGASNVSADFVGIACRRVKQATSFATENFGQYTDLDVADIMERGSISVVCPTGDPTPGSKVYIRVALNTTDYPDAVIGDIEAVADSTNNIEITNCKFFGPKDSNNVAEVVILTRQGV